MPLDSVEDGYNELVTFMRDGGRGPDMDVVLRGDWSRDGAEANCKYVYMHAGVYK